MMRRARYVLAACLLLAFWLFPFDRRAGGGEAKSGMGWNDGEMPPAFNPYAGQGLSPRDMARTIRGRTTGWTAKDIYALVLERGAK